jgi:hypothetical protein
MQTANRKNETPEECNPLLRALLTLPALWAGTVLALLSVADGMRNAVVRSQDFQWSPTRLLTRHVDPWTVYLAGDPNHRILLSQIPNYLHELYVLLLPLGWLSFAHAKIFWALCNLALLLLSCACIVRLYALPPRQAWLFCVLVGTGTPARVVLGNGQLTALVVAALALWAVASSASLRGLLLGLSYAKYSVAPPLAIFLALRQRWRLLAYSLLPPLAGFLFVYGWLRTTPLHVLLLEPFRTATAGNVSPGLANAMVVAEIFLRHPPLFHTVPDAFYLAQRTFWVDLTPYLCAVALAIALAAYFFLRAAQADGRVLLACLAASSLLCFQHQIYDFLLLAFCLALALRAPCSRARHLLLVGIGYFFWIERLVHIHRWEFWPSVVLASFVLLWAMIAAAWRLRNSITWTVPWEI